MYICCFIANFSIFILHFQEIQKGKYFIFKMVAVRRRGFLKFLNFIGWRGPEGWDASLCQISSKAVKLLVRFHDFRFFKIAATAILYCKNCKILVADTVPNVAKIGQTVFEILQFFGFSAWWPSAILNFKT